MAARQALVDLARARLWPDLGLVGGFRFTETTNASNPSGPFVNNPYHETSGYIALGLQGSFDIPQKLARIRQAEADLHEAVAMQVGAQQLIRLEMQQALGNFPGAIDNTARIAAMCNVELDFSKRYSPVYRVPKEKLHAPSRGLGVSPELPADQKELGQDAQATSMQMKDDEAYLRQLCEEGLVWRYGKTDVSPEVRERLSGQQAIVVGNSPQEFHAEIVREVARMRRATAAAHIEIN